MPARVLLIADPKMLPALAAGLREGGRFEVVTASSPEAAQELAAEPLQAAILFYGTPLWSLPAALQALKPLRDKGAQVVAVLQKAQVGLRDECFRAGASDAFFMPIPKEQFVGRLSASLGLAYGESDGLPASVQVASRSTPAGLPAATVTTAGVHGDASIPFEAGHTVRLTWKSNEEAFATWGLVVRSAPAQVRFAGLTAEEDSRLRSWLKASLPASGAAVSTAPMPTPPEGSTPAGGAAIISPSAPPAQVAILAEAGPNLEGAAPSAGLPGPGEAAGSPATAAPSAAPLGNLFDEQGAPSTRAPAETAAEPFSLGTPWPEPWPVEWCRGAAAALIHSQPVPTGPSGGAAVARKVLLKVTPSERAMAERPGEAGPSAVADAWMARIALAGAEIDGERLMAAGSTVLVDGDAVAALAKLVDGAGERLQQEANKFIVKGDTESLRVLTGARSALTQELLAFKKLADRLRGLGAAPALGPGGLDPDVQLAGRTPAKTRTPATGMAAIRLSITRAASAGCFFSVK